MGAAEKIETNASNRRQLFRIADPDFANLRVMIQGRDGPIECACLDISAIGLGVLVPRTAFETAQPGVILEYELQFGPLSPVKGLAVVANRAETTVLDEKGEMLRLGLRFSDSAHSREEAESVNRRRSARYVLPQPLQPLCICDDPLWFGETLTISIHDFSQHGLAGEVSAKKTVFAEGLRTVFKIAFPRVGVFEVPARIIYANPTSEASRFRMGCEFVRRSPEFTRALDDFIALHAIFSESRLERREDSGSMPAVPTGAPAGIGLISQRQELEKACAELEVDNRPRGASAHTVAVPIVCRHPNSELPREGLFHFSFLSERESDQEGGEEEEPLLGRRYLEVNLQNFSDWGLAEFTEVVRFVIYMGVVLEAHSLRFIAQDSVGSASEELSNRLQKSGLDLPDFIEQQGVFLFEMEAIKSCRKMQRSLWLHSILPLARHADHLKELEKQFDTWGALLFAGKRFFSRS